MVRVSKKELTRCQHDTLDKLMAAVFTSQCNDNDTSAILFELLIDIERSAISRRLAAIAMLDAGESYYSIRKSLGMGVDTLKKLESKLNNGSINHLKKTLRKLSNYKPTNKNRSIKGTGPLDKQSKEDLGILGTIEDVFNILPHYGESISGYRYRKLNRNKK